MNKAQPPPLSLATLTVVQVLEVCYTYAVFRAPAAQKVGQLASHIGLLVSQRRIPRAMGPIR